MPDYAIAVREFGGAVTGNHVRFAGIVARNRLAVHGRQIDFPDLRFRKSRAVHDIGVNLVMSGRHGGQRSGINSGLNFIGMQVPETLHVRHAHQEQMDKVSVVGHQIVEPQAHHGIVGILQLQPQHVAGFERCAKMRQLVRKFFVGLGFSGPPGVGEENNHDQKNCRGRHTPPCALHLRGRRSFSRIQLRFAIGCPDDPDRSQQKQ